MNYGGIVRHWLLPAARELPRRLGSGGSLTCLGAIEMRLSDDAVLFAHQPDLAVPVDSLTKLLTAIVVEESVAGLALPIAAAEGDIANPGVPFYIQAGESSTFADQLDGMIIKSLRRRRRCAARSALRRRLRVPDGFPEVAVGVAEIAGIAAVEGVGGGLDDGGAGGFGLGHHPVDRVAAGDIVAEREAGGAARGDGEPGVMGEVGLFPEREPEPAGKVEKGHSAMLELGADDAPGRKSQPVAVEGERGLEVVDGKRQHGKAGLHRRLLLFPDNRRAL